LSGRRPVLLLALGNDLLGDDGVGPAAARALRERFGDRVDIVESGEAGLALVEFLEGHPRVLILDAIVSGTAPPGTIREMGPPDFRRVLAPSPHYAGLPEVLALGERLGIEMPSDLRVLALEVEDPFSIRESWSPSVEAAFPDYVDRASRILEGWLALDSHLP
jgi:hydrogenase maturation protease